VSRRSDGDTARAGPVATIGQPPVTVPLQRILIVMMSAVGDVVHVMPVIHALKAHAPQAHITWVLQPGPATLVRGHPLVDDILLFDRSRGWRAFADIRRALSARRFDVLLALQVYFKAGLITGFANARVKLGFDRARARDANWLFTTDRITPRPGQHVQDQYFEFLDALGVPHGAPQWTLGPWNDEERAWQREFLAGFDRPIAPIVVATSKADKDWMPERWAAICRILWDDFGLQPVLVGGRSEREVAAEAIILRDAPMAYSALGSGLRRLSAILDGAAVALSPDTGPLHLAVALRTPVISLLGYTNPKRVGPYDFSRDLMIDAYGDPGEDYPLDMSYRHDRMSRITVNDVREMLGRWRERYEPARLEELMARGLSTEANPRTRSRHT
jgi:heptosyltransferase I